MLDDPGLVYVDDPTISDSEILYRMVNANTVRWQDGAVVRVQTNDTPWSSFRPQIHRSVHSTLNGRGGTLRPGRGEAPAGYLDMPGGGLWPTRLLKAPRKKGNSGV